MKLTSLFLALSAASISIQQNFPGEPDCAAPCLSPALASAGCSSGDTACLCGTARDAIQKAITPCLLSSCSQPDVLAAASAGLVLCASYEAAKTATPPAASGSGDEGKGGESTSESPAAVTQGPSEPVQETGAVDLGMTNGSPQATSQAVITATSSGPVESSTGTGSRVESGSGSGSGTGRAPAGGNGTQPIQVSGVDVGKGVLSAMAGLVTFIVACMAAL